MIVSNDVDFVAPGMTGEKVSAIQRLVGVDVTGTYDDVTEQAVRGLQMLHGTTLRDGCWDLEIEQAIARKG